MEMLEKIKKNWREFRDEWKRMSAADKEAERRAGEKFVTDVSSNAYQRNLRELTDMGTVEDKGSSYDIIHEGMKDLLKNAQQKYGNSCVPCEDFAMLGYALLNAYSLSLEKNAVSKNALEVVRWCESRKGETVDGKEVLQLARSIGVKPVHVGAMIQVYRQTRMIYDDDFETETERGQHDNQT